VPFRISFLDDLPLFWADVVDYSVDILFAIDLVLTVFSAYYDQKLNLITDRKVGCESRRKSSSTT
jgi:uncharacterized membrane protein